MHQPGTQVPESQMEAARGSDDSAILAIGSTDGEMVRGESNDIQDGAKN